MTEPRIPDRSAEPALLESLDHGAQSRTASQSEDVSRDAGKGPRDKSEDDPTKPDAEEVEEMTGVPRTSEELSQM